MALDAPPPGPDAGGYEIAAERSQSPARALQDTMRRLARRWQRRFDQIAPELAKRFATNVTKRSDAALRASLKKAGFTVEFKLSRAANDVLQATIGENVGLIKSIASQHLTQVQGAVMRSVQTGRDLGSLADELEHQFGVSKRRAALIARTQNNAATAAIQRVRHTELGITQAIWVHSGGGKHPRQSHLKAGRDREVYEIAKGWFDPEEQKYVLPGQLINCFPGDVLLQFAKNTVKSFRHWYCGELAEIVTATGVTLRATPNHPVLTVNGWLPIGLLKKGDDLIQIADEGIFSVPCELDEDNTITSFSQAFDAMVVAGTSEVALGADFHGDVVESDVDIVFVTRPLSLGVKSICAESVQDLPLAESDLSGFGLSAQQQFGVSSADTFDRGMSVSSQSTSLAGIQLAHSNCVRGAAVSASDPALAQNSGNDYTFVDGPQRLGDSQLALSSQVGGHNSVLVKTEDTIGGNPSFSAVRDRDPPVTQVPAEAVGTYTNDISDNRKSVALFYKPLRVIDNRMIDFSGHVYTLETESGWFSVSPDAIVVKNCRCVSRPVVPGFS